MSENPYTEQCRLFQKISATEKQGANIFFRENLSFKSVCNRNKWAVPRQQAVPENFCHRRKTRRQYFLQRKFIILECLQQKISERSRAIRLFQKISATEKYGAEFSSTENIYLFFQACIWKNFLRTRIFFWDPGSQDPTFFAALRTSI